MGHMPTACRSSGAASSRKKAPLTQRPSPLPGDADRMRRRGIEPMVTLFHFSSPRWLANRVAGATGRCRHFRRFVRHASSSWATWSSCGAPSTEPNVYAAVGYLLGKHVPGEKNHATASRC